MAVIEELKEREINSEILYIGSENGIEKKMIENMGIRFEGIKCGKLRRYFSWENFKDFFKIPVGFFQARKLLKDFCPKILFSKGGYVVFPVTLAAASLKIPVILHESDALIGMANKLAMRYADKIFLSFEETKAYIPAKYHNKVILTGNPIRKDILRGNKEKGYKFTALNKFRPIILAMGGSQGALQINGLIRQSLDELIKKFQIVHITGKGNLDIGIKKEGYRQYEYLDEQLKDVYSICEMIISRGGANSLAEIALLRKKALILPLGEETSRGDQIENAKIFSRKFGFGLLMGPITKDQFIEAVNLTFQNGQNRENFINGTDKVTDYILDKLK